MKTTKAKMFVANIIDPIEKRQLLKAVQSILSVHVDNFGNVYVAYIEDEAMKNTLTITINDETIPTNVKPVHTAHFNNSGTLYCIFVWLTEELFVPVKQSVTAVNQAIVDKFTTLVAAAEKPLNPDDAPVDSTELLAKLKSAKDQLLIVPTKAK